MTPKVSKGLVNNKQFSWCGSSKAQLHGQIRWWEGEGAQLYILVINFKINKSCKKKSQSVAQNMYTSYEMIYLKICMYKPVREESPGYMWEDSAVAENLGIKIWSFWVIGYNQLKH
jgi:hypothetical protein